MPFIRTMLACAMASIRIHTNTIRSDALTLTNCSHTPHLTLFRGVSPLSDRKWCDYYQYDSDHILRDTTQFHPFPLHAIGGNLSAQHRPSTPTSTTIFGGNLSAQHRPSTPTSTTNLRPNADRRHQHRHRRLTNTVDAVRTLGFPSHVRNHRLVRYFLFW